MKTAALKFIVHGIVATVLTPCSTWSMEEMDLSFRNLTTIPAEIYNLTATEKLDLRDNQLSKIPPEFCTLTNLKVLFINNNQLSTLPPDICNLTRLRKLHLGGNPLKGLESQWAWKMRKAKLKEFREFYTERRDLQTKTSLLFLAQQLDEGSPFADLPPDIINYMNLLHIAVSPALYEVAEVRYNGDEKI